MYCGGSVKPSSAYIYSTHFRSHLAFAYHLPPHNFFVGKSAWVSSHVASTDGSVVVPCPGQRQAGCFSDCVSGRAAGGGVTVSSVIGPSPGRRRLPPSDDSITHHKKGGVCREMYCGGRFIVFRVYLYSTPP